jgi:hypothetical protein
MLYCMIFYLLNFLTFKTFIIMSTRATLYIHWYNDSDLLDIKLYHHRDWYVEYLGVELEKALEKWRKNLNKAMKTGSYWNKKTLLNCITEIWWFEQAYPLHWDVEYIYHINYDIQDRKARYELYCQSGMEYWEEKLLKHKKVLLAKNWFPKWFNKKLDWKQAEIELGNRWKFIDWYLDS